jgi:hypothetical protein
MMQSSLSEHLSVFYLLKAPFVKYNSVPVDKKSKIGYNDET